MKLLYLPILLIVSMALYVPTADPIDSIADLMRQGNTTGLSKYFAPSVEMTVQGEENVCSKLQAGLILDKFFDQNKPKSVKIVHKVNSNANYLFAVIMLHTDKASYRVTYTLKDADHTMQLIELRIENEKVR